MRQKISISGPFFSIRLRKKNEGKEEKEEEECGEKEELMFLDQRKERKDLPCGREGYLYRFKDSFLC